MILSPDTIIDYLIKRFNNNDYIHIENVLFIFKDLSLGVIYKDETESLLIGNSTYDLYNLFTQKDGKHFESLSISNQYKKLTKLIDDYLGIKENIKEKKRCIVCNCEINHDSDQLLCLKTYCPDDDNTIY